MSVSGNSESLDIQSGDCAILMMLINNMKQLVQKKFCGFAGSTENAGWRWNGWRRPGG